MTARTLVPAMGGTRQVPAPDPIATDYLLLALRLDQHIPGLVDGYFGPAALKAQVDMEQGRSPARLRGDARALRERIDAEIADEGRRAWLDAQLVALEAQAAGLTGDPLPYEEHVARCMGFAPPRHADAEFTAARAVIAGRLPGDGPLTERLEAWDRDLEIAVDRLPAVIDWLIDRFRGRAARDFGLPDGEDLRVRLVTGQPWSGYNWFDGGRCSRVDINTDLPVRAPSLVHTVAHETYPGHHLEHAWKEADLVDRDGRMEASILLINTPECPVSEGLADLGTSFAVPADELIDLYDELFDRAGLRFAADPVQRRTTAEGAAALEPARRTLAATQGNAALLLHADGLPRDAVLDYLRDVGGSAPAVAAKRLEFIEHPLWRTYVFVYSEGEALLRRWVEKAPPAERAPRFARLLHEQVTPGRLLVGQD
ncbi:MAG: hypothetical protein ACSLFN_11330 [Candidatus Limnocylindrales bacterium]